MPDVDLFVRSSGEQRTSNFLLWQSAYAEMVFQDTLWPDYRRTHLWDAIAQYNARDRRFGGAVDAPTADSADSGASGSRASADDPAGPIPRWSRATSRDVAGRPHLDDRSAGLRVAPPDALLRRSEAAHRVADDVVAVGEDRVQRPLDVHAPEQLAPDPTPKRAANDPDEHHRTRRAEPDQQLGTSGERGSTWRYWNSVTHPSHDASAPTSSTNVAFAVHPARQYRPSISVCGTPVAAAMRPASVVLPDPEAPATRIRRACTPPSSAGTRRHRLVRASADARTSRKRPEGGSEAISSRAA